MAPLFKRRPSQASIQNPAAPVDTIPTSESPTAITPPPASPASANAAPAAAATPEPAITWGKRSRRSSMQSQTGTSTTGSPDAALETPTKDQSRTPVKRKPSFLKRLLKKDSPSVPKESGGMTTSSSSSSLASASGKSPRASTRPPQSASASITKTSSSALASPGVSASSSVEDTTSPSKPATATTGYKTWRRERGESKKVALSSLGRQDVVRDSRGDSSDEDEEFVASPGTVAVSPVVPGTKETELGLSHGETVAPNKLLDIASVRGSGLAIETAADPAGGLASTFPTSPVARGLPGSNPSARQMSNGESLWSLQHSDSDTSDENVGFETPDEGLSEVGEEDEEEEVLMESTPPGAPSPPVEKNVGDAHADVADLPPATNGTVAVPSTASTHSVERVRSSPVPDVYRPSPSVDQGAILDEDLAMCHRVLALFLNSHIAEAERIVQEGDRNRERLYYQLADAILCTLKGIMTFEPTDLKHAHNVTRYCTELSASLRKPSSGIGSRLSGFVKGASGSVAHIKGMSKVERHAELIYAETLLLKAVLGIISGGEWMALVKEALNMRSAEGIYRTLNTFCETIDKAHPRGFDDSVDMDFRSGVELGVGMSALMLSMMPGKVVKIAEVFGLQGSRPYALKKLAQPGGWDTNLPEPKVPAEKEGVRRAVADMGLMTFHLVISSLIPVTHVDVPMGAKILWWNLDRFPNGVFTLIFQARLHVLQCQPHVANKVLQKALIAQKDYIQLQLLSRWDLGINSLALNDFAHSAACFEQLYRESNWSKATYIYSTAAALLETTDCDQEVVLKYMQEVPKAIRKVVGKSIPIEKFVSRKSRKFLSQGRLALPGVEISYVYGLLQRTPGWCLQQRTIPRIDKTLATIEAATPETYGNGREYWDDFALAHMLRGVAYGLLAVPNHGAVIENDDPKEEPFDKHAMARAALDEFQLVLDNGRKILLDHFIVYYTHYELGCLYERLGKDDEAVKQFELVLHGKNVEVDTSKMTGKYSLHSGVTLKCTAAIQQIKEKQAAAK